MDIYYYTESGSIADYSITMVPAQPDQIDRSFVGPDDTWLFPIFGGGTPPPGVPVTPDAIKAAREDRDPFTLKEALETAEVKTATADDYAKQEADAEEAEAAIAEQITSAAHADRAEAEAGLRDELGDKVTDLLLRAQGRQPSKRPAAPKKVSK